MDPKVMGLLPMTKHQDVFVHVSALNGLTLQEGDKVEYVEEEGNKGKQASQIALL
jgi:CspA family cold shock protein